MQARLAISNAQWLLVAPAMLSATRRGPRGRDDRGFFEAICWMLRTGAPWRDLPVTFGPWSRVYRRFRRWALAGRWEALRRTLQRTDAKLALIDSTIVKAHPHAAGALRRTGGQTGQALGRSRGALTTKIHAVVTECGDLVRYVLTADRAYDSDAIVAHIHALGVAAIIPSRSNRRVARVIDRNVYRRRNVIERWFGRLKSFRRVATRYDKTQLSYAAFVTTAAFLVALAGWQA